MPTVEGLKAPIKEAFRSVSENLDSFRFLVLPELKSRINPFSTAKSIFIITPVIAAAEMLPPTQIVLAQENENESENGELLVAGTDTELAMIPELEPNLAAAAECPIDSVSEDRTFYAGRPDGVLMKLAPTASAEILGIWNQGSTLMAECYIDGEAEDGSRVRWRRLTGPEGTAWTYPQGNLSDRPPAIVSKPPVVTEIGGQTDEQTPNPEKAFPEIIGDLEKDGFTIKNMGTKYGLDISDLEFVQNVGAKLAPDSKEQHLQYLIQMFKKYSGGKKLDITFNDTPQGYAQRVQEAPIGSGKFVEFEGERNGDVYHLRFALAEGFKPSPYAIDNRNTIAIVNQRISALLGAQKWVSQAELESHLFQGTNISGDKIKWSQQEAAELTPLNVPGMFILKF